MLTPPRIAHPSSIPNEFKRLGELKNPNKPNNDYIFLMFENLLVIFMGNDWTHPVTKHTKYLKYQACFPLAVLPWVMQQLGIFSTPPNQGGLKEGKISNKAEVEGETLLFTRGVCVGGPDHGGYILENLSRIDYGKTADSCSYQGFDFPDPFMYDGGLLEFWKDLAEKYQKGIL
ncbi:hypothetical protein [Thalassotalea ganghwensis]